ncbi:MAG: dTDP-4-dehydrorhamnose 3,5-epimerase [Anaerolineae bacterium]|nr:dTDP-4-dehydrorhamnose 3,5-epimerase [Anaerolineae bacterium]
MPFRFQKLNIPDVILIEPRILKDQRGFFMETYKRSEFAANGIPGEFVQSNYSHSTRGTLRGLHYQKHPKAQGKLVMALRGAVFDVAADIREGSPTYGQWVSTVLSDKNFRMLYIPVGFAHGFCVLSEEAGFVYQVTAEYAPELDRGILWNDPAIGIQWPISEPMLSSKDARLPLLQEADIDFVYKETQRAGDHLGGK